MRRLALLALVLIGTAVTTVTSVLTEGLGGSNQVLLADGDDYDTGSG